MRLLLDAHISGPRVGKALEDMGHDVRATERMERLPDKLILEMAVEEDRILITHNTRDFLKLVMERLPEEGHPGLVLIPPSVQLHNFGVIIPASKGRPETFRKTTGSTASSG